MLHVVCEMGGWSLQRTKLGGHEFVALGYGFGDVRTTGVAMSLVGTPAAATLTNAFNAAMFDQVTFLFDQVDAEMRSFGRVSRGSVMAKVGVLLDGGWRDEAYDRAPADLRMPPVAVEVQEAAPVANDTVRYACRA